MTFEEIRGLSDHDAVACVESQAYLQDRDVYAEANPRSGVTSDLAMLLEERLRERFGDFEIRYYLEPRWSAEPRIRAWWPDGKGGSNYGFWPSSTDIRRVRVDAYLFAMQEEVR